VAVGLQIDQPAQRRTHLLSLSTLAALAVLAGCTRAEKLGLNPSETLTQGYVIDQQQIDQVPVGSSREQVILALGSPSTTATFDNEVFYYISQTRKRPVAFLNPHIVNQRVLAVYFGTDGRVTQIANYGLKDGKVFDFISRTTPTGGKDQNFIGQMISGVKSSPVSLPGQGGGGGGG
jgi:outer membrane protein assembly factor BamE (lipoprotein component of BamABCDE complex)